MDVKTAIRMGDSGALRSLLAEDPSAANRLIEWGEKCEIRTHPLHYVSDMLFDGTLQHGKEIALVDALLAAGGDYNHQALNGETPLIGAASLAAEDVGLRLLDSGARTELLGAFKETALHWAAHLGLRRLSARLLNENAGVNVKDARYHSSPLGWAIHGHFTSLPGKQEHYYEVVALLVAAGATVEPEWLVDEQILADPKMLAVLNASNPKPTID